MFRRKPTGKASEGDNPLASRVVRGDDRPTEPMPDRDPAGVSRARSGASSHPSAEPPTRLIDPPTGHSPGAVDDPPVAVLLIVSGPGQGHLLPVGHGTNSLGRNGDQRICIDFGDPQLSRERHAILTHDARGGQFFLQHGGGKGVTYLNGSALLEPTTLESGDRILLGATELLFRPLVGEDFDWSSHGTSAPAP